MLYLKRSISAFLVTTLVSVSSFAMSYDSKAQYSILMDADTGAVLFEKSPDEKMTPSSMTKLMTIYILFDLLKKGVYKLDDTFIVSETAWRTGGSKMFVKVNDPVTIEDLLKGIVIQSGNDACVVVAEGIAQSEENFAELMNKKAKELGLTNSHFKNSMGMPDPEHYMSARDIAILSDRLIHDFPEYYHYFAMKEYVYSGITQSNRNLLLWRDASVDGLKTGHTEEAGYGIAVSAKRDGRRLISVVNGLKSINDRATESESLINYGFRYFDNLNLFNKDTKVEQAEVRYGSEDKVPLMTGSDIKITIPSDHKDKVSLSVSYEGPLSTPIKKGDKVATLKVETPGSEPQEFPLFAGSDVDKASFFKRIIQNIQDKIAG